MKVGSDMARPSLFTHRKFVRLSRLLGAAYKAAGVLETLWHHAYQDGEPRLGSAEDVEYMIGWDGEPGACADALLETGFLEECAGGLMIHDLADHAPDYVLGRYQKEAERRGITLSRNDVREILRGNLVLRQSKDKTWTVEELSQDCLPTPAPAPAPAHKKESPTDSLARKKAKYPDEFEQFWKAYPKKKSKADAAKAWKQTKKDRPPIDDLLSKLDELMSSKEWQKDGGQWIPYPATWIRAGGWDDETKTSTRQGGKYAREETDYDAALYR